MGLKHNIAYDMTFVYRIIEFFILTDILLEYRDKKRWPNLSCMSLSGPSLCFTLFTLFPVSF